MYIWLYLQHGLDIRGMPIARTQMITKCQSKSMGVRLTGSYFSLRAYETHSKCVLLQQALIICATLLLSYLCTQLGCLCCVSVACSVRPLPNVNKPPERRLLLMHTKHFSCGSYTSPNLSARTDTSACAWVCRRYAFTRRLS